MYKDKPDKTILQAIQTSQSETIQELLQYLDVETVYILIKVFGGNNLFIPKIDKYINVSRNQNIIDEYCAGLTYNQISRKYGLSERTIRCILNKKL